MDQKHILKNVPLSCFFFQMLLIEYSDTLLAFTSICYLNLPPELTLLTGNS